MEPIFKSELTVTEMQVDRFGRVRPAVLLYYLQEAAGQHCNLLAVDHDTLSEKQLFWAVTRTRVQVTRLPRLGEKVLIETWPMPPPGWPIPGLWWLTMRRVRSCSGPSAFGC